MNLVVMAAKKDKAANPPISRAARRTGTAFDLWLQRGLHQMFDDVASEPVPEDLLRLIEDDRKSTK